MVSAGASATATDDNDNDHRFNVPNSHSHNETSAGHMNMRGVFLHLLADALGSVIVIVSALVCIHIRKKLNLIKSITLFIDNHSKQLFIL